MVSGIAQNPLLHSSGMQVSLTRTDWKAFQQLAGQLTRGEGLLAASDHHGRHALVGLDLFKGVADLCHQGVGEGVEGLGAVEGDQGHAVIGAALLHEDVLVGCCK